MFIEKKNIIVLKKRVWKDPEETCWTFLVLSGDIIEETNGCLRSLLVSGKVIRNGLAASIYWILNN